MIEPTNLNDLNLCNLRNRMVVSSLESSFPTYFETKTKDNQLNFLKHWTKRTWSFACSSILWPVFRYYSGVLFRNRPNKNRKIVIVKEPTIYERKSNRNKMKTFVQKRGWCETKSYSAARSLKQMIIVYAGELHFSQPFLIFKVR